MLLHRAACLPGITSNDGVKNRLMLVKGLPEVLAISERQTQAEGQLCLELFGDVQQAWIAAKFGNQQMEAQIIFRGRDQIAGGKRRLHSGQTVLELCQVDCFSSLCREAGIGGFEDEAKLINDGWRHGPRTRRQIVR